MAQNDISLEQVSRQNTIKQEKLRKMKSNIQALQMNLAKKKMAKNTNQKQVQPIAIYDHMQSFESKTKSPVNYNSQNDFDYNSTLFKQIGNESQPFINNGSGLSNFSSVSNINQILNGHNLQHQPTYPTSQPQQGDKLFDDIDKILSKVQKTQNIPNKVLQKIISQKEQKPIVHEEPLISSKLTSSGEFSVRTKLQQYKQLINKLDTIEEEKPRKDSWNHKAKQQEELKKIKEEISHEQKFFPKTFQIGSAEPQLSSYRTHQKEPSGLTYRSQYNASDDSKYPLPGHPPKPMNAVQRQKMRIKESMMEMKKLQTQSSHEMLDRSIDFELSDQETQPNKISKLEKPERKKLLQQKQKLLNQLKQIEEELSRLESQVQ